MHHISGIQIVKLKNTKSTQRITLSKMTLINTIYDKTLLYIFATYMVCIIVLEIIEQIHLYIYKKHTLLWKVSIRSRV
jgi:hypothetical protein